MEKNVYAIITFLTQSSLLNLSLRAATAIIWKIEIDPN